MIKADYEQETGNQIVKAFKNLSYKEVQMALVASQGSFTWGKTPEKAVYNSVILEELAKMSLLTLLINSDITEIKQTLIDKHYQRKRGRNAYYGQNKEGTGFNTV